MFDRFRNATTSIQAAIVALALAAFVIVLALAWFFAIKVDYKPIFTKLRTTDAAAIVAELDKQKIPYRLSDAGTTISVPEDRADATRLNLFRTDLSLKDSVGFELFNKSDMGITDFAQKINYQRALQGELERTIAGLDGVEAARVHLSMGDDRLFRQDRVAPKASITLRMVNAALVPAGTVAGVQQLVSAAVPQLDPSAVVVLDEGGQILSGQTAVTPTEDQLSPSIQEKRAIEAYYEARIRSALDNSFGADSVAVTVWIDGNAISTGVQGPSGGENRKFRMQVNLMPNTAFSREAQESARTLVANAIGYDASLGDAILFGGAPPAAPASLPEQRPVVRVANGNDLLQNSAEAMKEPQGGNIVPPIIASLVVLGALVALTMMKRRSPVQEDSRTAFADRLKTLLDEDAADGSRTA